MTADAKRQATVYEIGWTGHQQEQWEQLKANHPPAEPTRLFGLVDSSRLTPQSVALDVGCGSGEYACELARRFNVQVVAIDPADGNLEKTQERIEVERRMEQITVRKGSMERIPVDDGTVALIWCRGVLVHVPDLARGFAECRRVLAPGGMIVVLDNYATSRMAPAELALLRRLFGFAPQSMNRDRTEAAIQQAGLTITNSNDLSSEFAEFYEAQQQRSSKALLDIAKLLRLQEQFIQTFGQPAYDSALAMNYWHVFQLLGKIGYQAYVLSNDA